MVGQHYFLEFADEPVGADQVAEPRPGHGPGLGIRAQHHQRHFVAEHRDCALLAELPVCLIDAQQPAAAGHQSENVVHVSGIVDDSGGVVGRTEERHIGAMRIDDALHLAEVESEVRAPLAGHHRSAGDPAQMRMQRIGRFEHGRGPVRAAVGQQQGLQHLIGSVGCEHPGRAHAVEFTDTLPQLCRRAVGVAVPVDRAAGLGQRLTKLGRRRFGALVGVEADLDVELR